VTRVQEIGSNCNSMSLDHHSYRSDARESAKRRGNAHQHQLTNRMAVQSRCEIRVQDFAHEVCNWYNAVSPFEGLLVLVALAIHRCSVSVTPRHQTFVRSPPHVRKVPMTDLGH